MTEIPGSFFERYSAAFNIWPSYSQSCPAANDCLISIGNSLVDLRSNLPLRSEVAIFQAHDGTVCWVGCAEIVACLIG